MGYAHIDNLYKEQTILLLKECFALEKIHGTSAHIAWKGGKVTFFSGGESHVNFVALFDEAKLAESFQAMGNDSVTIYGEAYGGKQQGNSWRYGKQLKFIVFDVKVNEFWLSVPDAHAVATKFGLEFVHYDRTPTDLDALNALRDAPSVQAKRNGIEEDQPREGVVLRPINPTLHMVFGEKIVRICAKHKRDDERETQRVRTFDPNKQQVLEAAQAIAQEWVTDTRLDHVLDKLKIDGALPGMERTPDVIRAMIEDVYREGAGEIVESRDAAKAIGAMTARMFKQRHVDSLRISTPSVEPRDE